MTITLNDIWQSSTGLLKRFDLMPTLDAAWMKCLEEYTEATEALYELQCRPRNEILKSAASMEICDCIVTLFNLAYARGDYPPFIHPAELRSYWAKAAIETASKKDAWIVCHNQIAFAKQHVFTAPTGSHMSGAAVVAMMLAMMNLARMYGLTYEDIERSMESVMTKNGAKTHQTHEVRDGMIKKRKPAEEAL